MELESTVVYLCNLEKAGFTSVEEKIDHENNFIFFLITKISSFLPVYLMTSRINIPWSLQLEDLCKA